LSSCFVMRTFCITSSSLRMLYRYIWYTKSSPIALRDDRHTLKHRLVLLYAPIAVYRIFMLYMFIGLDITFYREESILFMEQEDFLT